MTTALRPSPSITVGETLETQQPFGAFADYLHAARRAEVEPYDVDPRLLPLRAAGLGNQEGVGSDGGFLVPVQFATGIMDRAFRSGEILRRCYRVPMQGNRFAYPAIDETSRVTGSRFGGARGYWTGEGVLSTASRPTFRRGILDLKKLTVFAYATEEMSEDAPAFAQVVDDCFAQEVTFLTEQAIVEGVGDGMPLGIVNSPALITQTAEGGQTAATINADNVSKMYARLSRRSGGAVVWLVHRDAEQQLDKVTAGQMYAGAPSSDDESYGRLKQRPVIATEYNAPLGSVGDIILADLSQYLIGERRGPELARSMHVRFLQGEDAFRLTYRVDGQPLWNAPTTPLKGTNTVSPFITLAAR